MIPASAAPRLWPQLAPIILLVCSNVFMTLAWYGHLKFKSVPLVTVVLVSWGIAFRGILLRGAGEPHRQRRLFPGRAQDHPGGDHADRVRRLHRVKEPLSLAQGAGFGLIALGAVLVFRGQG
jgi:uncharacterized protein (DUF486 family)